MSNEQNFDDLNVSNNKTIEKLYDEYYPLYNECVEVCKNEKCGVINILED